MPKNKSYAQIKNNEINGLNIEVVLDKKDSEKIFRNPVKLRGKYLSEKKYPAEIYVVKDEINSGLNSGGEIGIKVSSEDPKTYFIFMSEIACDYYYEQGSIFSVHRLDNGGLVRIINQGQ